MCGTFNLKKACRDCPFKKRNAYLHPSGLKERFNQVTKKDQSFSCHKTVDYDAYNDYQEAKSEIEDILPDPDDLGYTVDLESFKSKAIELINKINNNENET